MKDPLRNRLDAILERTAAATEPGPELAVRVDAPTVPAKTARPHSFGADTRAVRQLPRPPAEREHDLPPRWDGRPVTWEQWEIETPTSMVFHLGPEAFACPICGVVDAMPLRARGRARYDGADVGPADVLLAATRCPHCAHDQIYDFDAHELYDLDASDYRDEGST